MCETTKNSATVLKSTALSVSIRKPFCSSMQFTASSVLSPTSSPSPLLLTVLDVYVWCGSEARHWLSSSCLLVPSTRGSLVPLKTKRPDWFHMRSLRMPIALLSYVQTCLIFLFPELPVGQFLIFWLVQLYFAGVYFLDFCDILSVVGVSKKA